jgi:hypothetical protein
MDSSSGTSITGTVNGSNIEFLFRNIEGYDAANDTVQQWTKPPEGSTSWQRNSEYDVAGSTTTSTVFVQLILDASTSLEDSQITQIRNAVDQFIEILYDRVN